MIHPKRPSQLQFRADLGTPPTRTCEADGDPQHAPVALMGSIFARAALPWHSPPRQDEQQRPLGRASSWPGVTATFLFDVAMLVAISHLPDGRPGTVLWWLGVTAAATVTIAAALTYHGITVVPALAKWLWSWFRYWRQSTATAQPASIPGSPPGIDHWRRFGHGVVGMRELRGQLVAVIAVNDAADMSPGGRQYPTGSPATLPVPAVAAALRQFDVRLDAIDIVSVRKRNATERTSSPVPHNVDSAPTGDQNGTWLVLRMDTQHNVAAVAARDSVASTLAAAVERLAGDLNTRRCTARPVAGDEFARVDAAVRAGLQRTPIRPGLCCLRHLDKYVTSFWVAPRRITSGNLNMLCRQDTDATVMTVRLTATAGRAEVSAWVRYHSSEPLGKDFWAAAGLSRLIGHQLAAVRASLPTPLQRPTLVVPSRELGDQDQLAVRVGTVEAELAAVTRRPSPALNDGAWRAKAVGACKGAAVRMAGLLGHGIRRRHDELPARPDKKSPLPLVAK